MTYKKFSVFLSALSLIAGAFHGNAMMTKADWLAMTATTEAQATEIATELSLGPSVTLHDATNDLGANDTELDAIIGGTGTTKERLNFISTIIKQGSNDSMLLKIFELYDAIGGTGSDLIQRVESIIEKVRNGGGGGVLDTLIGDTTNLVGSALLDHLEDLANGQSHIHPSDDFDNVAAALDSIV